MIAGFLQAFIDITGMSNVKSLWLLQSWNNGHVCCAMGCKNGAFKVKVCVLGSALTLEMGCFIFSTDRMITLSHIRASD